MTHGPVTRHADAWALGLMQIRVGASASNIATITPCLLPNQSIGAVATTKYAGTAEFFRQMSGFPKKEDGVIPLSEKAQLECAFKEITPYTMTLARGLDPVGGLAAAAYNMYLNTTLGTVDSAKAIAVDGVTPEDWAPIEEEYTVVFSGAAAGDIYGRRTGLVHTFANLSSAMEPVDGNGDKLFSVPASYFTGTWAAGDTFVFATTAKATSTLLDDLPSTDIAIGLGGLVAPVSVRVEGVYTYPNGKNQLIFVFPRAQVVANMEVDFSEDTEAAPPIILESKTASSDNSEGHANWDNMPLGRMYWKYIG